MKCIDMEVLLIRLMVSLVSLSGCLWHLSDISKIYFNYETNVNVNFEREIMVSIPGVTICINVSHTIREDYIKEKYTLLKEIPEESKYYWLNKYLKNLTLYEQLFEATRGYDEIFNKCDIIKPIGFEKYVDHDYIACDKITPIQQYLTYTKKCFFIASQLNNESDNRYTVDHDTTLRDNGFPLFQIQMKNVFIDQPVVFINSRTTPFLGFIGGQTNGIHLNNTKYSSYTLNYVKTTSNLLPPPYKTMCRNYSTIGYQTLSHCIISCKANYFLEKFSGWHPDIPANNEYNLNVTYADLTSRENKTLDKLMAEQCRQICSKQQDCQSEYYSISITGQFERSDEFAQYKDHHGIYIYLPAGLNTRYSHSPRLHLIEYICYFASVFSLWFGFSIITISKVLIRAYNYYKERHSKNPAVDMQEKPIRDDHNMFHLKS